MSTMADMSQARDASTRPPKRQRISLACGTCREKKSRCDGARPTCSTCKKQGIDCQYEQISLSKTGATKLYLDELVSRLLTLEGSVGGLQSRVAHLENQQATPDLSVDAEEDNETDTLDRERMERINQRRDPTDGVGSVVFTKDAESAFFGPSSNIALTRQIIQATASVLRTSDAAFESDSSGQADLHNHILHFSRPPSPASHGTIQDKGYSVGSEPFILPAEGETMELIELFFASTGMLFPYIDREGLENKFRELLATNLQRASKNWLGLLNMILAMATSASYAGALSASKRSNSSRLYFQRAMRISEQEFRKGATLETIQLLLLMSQYLQGTERSIETWNLHGLAVKAAYQLGLHSPSSLKHYDPLARETRTRTWYACVLVDRTLSMTMGRPCAIPENFVRLDLPVPLRLSRSAIEESPPTFDEIQSVSFFNATIRLYQIMNEVVDLLYGSNLGIEVRDDAYQISAHIIHIERKLHAWKRTLPPEITVIEDGLLPIGSVYSDLLRYRVILSLRFLNIQVLAHRPLFVQCLEALCQPTGHSDQASALRSSAWDSAQICIRAANAIISLMRSTFELPPSPRHLLGAWWFSLFYAFNAALIIFGGLLLQHQAFTNNKQLGIDIQYLSLQTLHDASNCLSMLAKGNRMTEKCVRYTSALAHIMSSIQVAHQSQLGRPAISTPMSQTVPSDEIYATLGPLEGFDVFDPTDLCIGMGMNDLFSTATFDHLSHLETRHNLDRFATTAVLKCSIHTVYNAEGKRVAFEVIDL